MTPAPWRLGETRRGLPVEGAIAPVSGEARVAAPAAPDDTPATNRSLVAAWPERGRSVPRRRRHTSGVSER